MDPRIYLTGSNHQLPQTNTTRDFEPTEGHLNDIVRRIEKRVALFIKPSIEIAHIQFEIHSFYHLQRSTQRPLTNQPRQHSDKPSLKLHDLVNPRTRAMREKPIVTIRVGMEDLNRAGQDDMTYDNPIARKLKMKATADCIMTRIPSLIMKLTTTSNRSPPKMKIYTTTTMNSLRTSNYSNKLQKFSLKTTRIPTASMKIEITTMKMGFQIPVDILLVRVMSPLHLMAKGVTVAMIPKHHPKERMTWVQEDTISGSLSSNSQQFNSHPSSIPT